MIVLNSCLIRPITEGLRDPPVGEGMSVPKEVEEDFEFEDSTFEINSPAVANDDLMIESEPVRAAARGQVPMRVEDELAYYKKKAIHQDILIFEMRALLQSG